VISEKNCEERSSSESQSIAEADFQHTVPVAELYVRSNAIVSRLIAGETLVLPVRRGIGDLTCLYSFNRTGTTIWDALQKPQSLPELCDLINCKYDLSKQKAEEDVSLFVRELCSLGLAEVAVGCEAAAGAANNKNSGRSSALE
jgi:coenzyme PQQ synthesis protein D (PqqD)